MMKRLLAACALGSLLFAGVAQAKVLVVADVPVTADWVSGELSDKVNLRGLRAVTTVLDRYGADYKVVSPTQINTQMCRIGVVNRVRKDVSAWAYDSVATPERFDAVIHVGFNGRRTNPANDASAFSSLGYTADSLTLVGTAGAQMPSVPQLMLLDDIYASLGSSPFDNNTRDSTWVTVSGYCSSGQCGGNHEGEGTAFSADNPAFRWFDTIYGAHLLKKSGNPSGGMRVLMAGVANGSFTQMEDTGQMMADPDSASYSNTDTMKVWVKLNQYGSQNGADVVFATAFSNIGPDSTSSAGPGTFNTYNTQSVNWPVLVFAMAHLDSLTGGNVLGTKKVLKWGVGITHAGNTSDRRHPGGFFLADSSIVAASMDSVKATGAKVVVFADPESLAVRPWQVAIFNRIGSVRWAPVSQRVDSTIVGMGATSFTTPSDVWGRYRNRNIYGGTVGSSMGADSSIYGQLVNSRRMLAAQVGSGKLSTALLAPQFDWSPFQLRAHQNAGLLDSLLWMTHQLGGPLLTLGNDRDLDPAYVPTNPRGWILKEGRYRSAASGSSVRVMGISPVTVRGSRVGIYGDGLSFLTPATADTIPPLCDVTCPSMNASVWQESRFWAAFFGPGTDVDLTQGHASDDIGKTVNVKDRLYQYDKASVLLLPAQTFGGQSSTTPNRWGYFVVKHLMNATKAINAKAGRVVIANDFVDDIEP